MWCVGLGLRSKGVIGGMDPHWCLKDAGDDGDGQGRSKRLSSGLSSSSLRALAAPSIADQLGVEGPMHCFTKE